MAQGISSYHAELKKNTASMYSPKKTVEKKVQGCLFTRSLYTTRDPLSRAPIKNEYEVDVTFFI